MLLAVLLAAGVAGAEPSDQEKETARRLFSEGNSKYAAGDYAGALKDYQAADAIMEVTSTGFKVGRTLAALGRLLAAREKLLAVSRTPVQEGEPEALASARRDAVVLATELRDRIPTLLVKVAGVGPNVVVELTIDGRPLRYELSGVPQSLDPGAHRVRAAARGFGAIEQRVRLVERQHEVVTLTLQPSSVPDPPPPKPDGPGRSVSPLVWVGFGVGLAGVALGTVAGVVSLGAADRLHDACDQSSNTCPPTSRDDLDQAQTFASLSTAAYVVAGVGAAVGVVGLVLTFGGDGRERGAEAFLAPNGVGLRVRF